MRPLACLLLCACVAPAAEPAVTRTFAVAELVTPIPDCAVTPLGKVTAPPPAPTGPTRAELMAALLRTLDDLAPNAAGWARLSADGLSLTVTHAPAVVERVAADLAARAAAMNQSVAFECRILTLPAGTAANLTAGPAVVPAERAEQFLAAVHGHPMAAVMQCPKVTVFDGQRAGVAVVDEQEFVTAVSADRTPTTDRYRTGTAFEVRPRVAADRRAVAVEFAFQQAEIAPTVPLFPVTHFVSPTGGGEPVPFTQFVQQPKLTRREVRHAATVADGQTLVASAGRRPRTETRPAGPLARVPYLNRLTAGTVEVEDDVVVLLTVRVLNP